MCILRVLPEKTSERIGQERAGTEWTVVKSKIRLCIRNRSYGRFFYGGILMGIVLPIPSHRAKSHDFAHWWPAVSRSQPECGCTAGKIKFLIIDSRYRSRKPLIVTTNLTLTELKNPQDTAHARIYDRLLELCTPIACTGPSMRKDGATCSSSAKTSCAAL